MPNPSPKPIDVEFDQGQQQVILKFNDGRETAEIALEAADVDDVLFRLAAKRPAMRDQVKIEWEPDSAAQPVDEPAWMIGDRLYNGKQLLAFQHPGFGWVSFLLERERAEAIASGLHHRSVA